jgi:DNA-binding beta-propeller fold protein YncE
MAEEPGRRRTLTSILRVGGFVVAAAGAVVLTVLLSWSKANGTADAPASHTVHGTRQFGTPSSPEVHRTHHAATHHAPTHHAPTHVAAPRPWLAPAKGRGHLRPGSRPSALPGMLLIADKLNNRLIIVDPRGRIRWQFPRPGDLAHGQSFRVPDDAFFTPDGRYIIATQEDNAVISIINVARHRIVYRYGVPGHPGSGRNHLSNPDDAMVLPNGDIFTADIMNCRLLLIAPHTHRPLRVIGRTTTACRHAPPRHWGSPNGAFPMAHHRFLVTEINGDWVDAIGLHGKVYWSTHPPRVVYPSDSNQIGRNRFLTVDYSARGQVVIFTRRGRPLWRWYGPPHHPLNHPSLALPLPNGYIALNDDYNHRVLIVNPRTKRVVWQYGVSGVPGRRPGYLDNPDGIDLVPPNSLVATR